MGAVAAGLIVGLAATVAPASAGAQSYAVASGCEHYQGYVEGDEAAVAPRVPDGYTLVRDRGSGRPVLFVRAVRCPEVAIDNRTVPVTFASFGAVVESPDGRGCFSGAPFAGAFAGDRPPACNWYVLSWQADDRGVVRWLRGGTPGFPAVYAPELRYTLDAFDPAKGGAPFGFEAPASAPAPFRMDAVGRERPGEAPIRGGYWHDTPQGIVKVAFSTENMVSGDASGTVTAAAGSELAALMGATERSFLPGYSNFAAERWERAVYRKQIVTPGATSDSFDGSCSLHGDVRFKPPATNTPGTLAYTYDGDGTCTGTLNGRDVADAPVTIHTEGHSYGSCSGAETTSPGHGVLRFADGPPIRFTQDFTSVTTEIDFTWYGYRSGTAPAQGTFRTTRTSGDVAAQCRTTGVEQIPMDVTMTTQTPLVSDRRAGPGSRGGSPRPGGRPGAERAAGAPRLRLSVAPRVAPAGRFTPFRFRVRTAGGRPVAGALVRFAGRRARTGPGGRARIGTVVRGTGRRMARAAMRGFGPGRASVRVR